VPDSLKPRAILHHGSLLFKHIQRRKKKKATKEQKNTFVSWFLFSWFWPEPGPHPGCPENILYLSLEMHQT